MPQRKRSSPDGKTAEAEDTVNERTMAEAENEQLVASTAKEGKSDKVNGDICNTGGKKRGRKPQHTATSKNVSPNPAKNNKRRKSSEASVDVSQPKRRRFRTVSVDALDIIKRHQNQRNAETSGNTLPDTSSALTDNGTNCNESSANVSKVTEAEQENISASSTAKKRRKKEVNQRKIGNSIGVQIDRRSKSSSDLEGTLPQVGSFQTNCSDKAVSDVSNVRSNNKLKSSRHRTKSAPLSKVQKKTNNKYSFVLPSMDDEDDLQEENMSQSDAKNTGGPGTC